MKKISGLNCFEFKDNFNHLLNINIDNFSNVFYYDYYSLDEIDYITTKNTFFEYLYNTLMLESEILFLYIISGLIPYSEFKLKSKIKLNNIEIESIISETKNIIIENIIIKVGFVEINNKTLFFKAMDFLFSGYNSVSFISNNKIELNKINSTIFLLEKNRHKQIIGTKIDYSKLKALSNNIYFTYGGFDFGSLIFANF